MNDEMFKLWAAYRMAAVPHDADTVQVIETQQAFYAGAWAILCKLDVIDGAQMDNGADAYFDKLRSECRAHKEATTGG